MEIRAVLDVATTRLIGYEDENGVTLNARYEGVDDVTNALTLTIEVDALVERAREVMRARGPALQGNHTIPVPLRELVALVESVDAMREEPDGG